MSHTAFLAAIRETPDDDTPRLVYADWLEDNGDSPRAEFIRLQCRLARMDPDDLDRRDLQLRIWAMEREHAARWAADLPVLRGIEWAIYQRGFIEIIRAANFKALVEAAPRVRTATVLRGVVLSLVTGFKTFRNTECLAGLEYLNLLPKNGITQQCVLSLAGCEDLAGLRHLVLNAHGMTIEGAQALADSPHLASLHQLAVSSVELHPDGVRALVASSHWPELRQLYMTYTNAGHAEIEALASNATLANLEFLHLHARSLTEDSIAALADSQNLGRLHSLSLASNRLNPSAIGHLASSPLARRLRLLDIPFDDQGLGRGASYLAESPHLSLLRELHLGGCRIGDRGAAHLAASATLRGLTRLQLGNNDIGDAGVKALAESLILANIRHLDLSGNAFSDEGVLALARSPYLDRPQSLYLGNAPLSTAARQALRDRFPGVEGP